MEIIRRPCLGRHHLPPRTIVMTLTRTLSTIESKVSRQFLFACMLLTLLTNSYFPSVTLDCKPNLMRLHLNFTEPFRGVVSVGRSSWDELGGGEAATAKEAKRCSIRGQGSRRYRLDLDHRSCRTTFDVRMCSMLRLIH